MHKAKRQNIVRWCVCVTRSKVMARMFWTSWKPLRVSDSTELVRKSNPGPGVVLACEKRDYASFRLHTGIKVKDSQLSHSKMCWNPNDNLSSSSYEVPWDCYLGFSRYTTVVWNFTDCLAPHETETLQGCKMRSNRLTLSSDWGYIVLYFSSFVAPRATLTLWPACNSLACI